MANSNNSQKQSLKLKNCQKDHGLAASSNSESRFTQYPSGSSFPPLPPVSSLTAIQRLKRFKAICKKQQLAASNGGKSNIAVSGKKSLGITLIVRKKGVRKSLANTPGKSPYIRCARRKTPKQKSVSNRKNSRVLDLRKMTEVNRSVGEIYTNGNTGFEAASSPEKICELKKGAANLVFLNDRNGEETTEPCRVRPVTESFVEYPDENGSNDSEEIDVVNSKHEILLAHQFSTNGHLNGESNGLDAYHSTNGFNSHENGSFDDDEKAKIQSDDRTSDRAVGSAISNEVSETSTIDSADDSSPKSGPDSIDCIDVKPEGKVEEREERFPKNSMRGEAAEFQEDASFDAVLQVSMEDGSSNEATSDNIKEHFVSNPKKTPTSKSEAPKPVCELESEDSVEMPVLTKVHAFSEQQSDESMEVSDPDSLNVSKSIAGSGVKKPASKVVKEKSKKKKSPKPSPKKQQAPKTPASPKKRPQKRKSSPVLVSKNKSKSKKDTQTVFQLSTSSNSPSQTLTEIQIPVSSKLEPSSDAGMGGEKAVSRDSPQKPPVSSQPTKRSRKSQSKQTEAAASSTKSELSNDDGKESEKAVSTGSPQAEPETSLLKRARRSLKRKELIASIAMDTTERTSLSSVGDVDLSEPSTSKSAGSRRSGRSFSPSRRMPLRSSTRRSGAGVTGHIVGPTPVSKRKAETAADDSTKRFKTEVFETPRWSFLSSPLRSYWSPQLTNKIHYKQPDDTPTPEQPVKFKDEETPQSPSDSESSNTASSKSWCTIA